MRLLPSIRALYSRRSLMSFVLAEVFLQALCMMNSPSHRLRRRNAHRPARGDPEGWLGVAQGSVMQRGSISRSSIRI